MAIPRIWVDTDVALGAPRGDVDDGFALAALGGAVRQGGAELLGISTVFGNATAAESEACAGEITARCGVSVRIVRGAEKPGEDSEAAEAIAALPDGSELLCLGPLTNIAAACWKDSGLAGRVSLRAVGGNLSSRGLLPPLWPFEFNFARDRQAARGILSGEWRGLTLYPLDVVRDLRVGPARWEELRQASSLGAYLAEHSERWLWRARWRHLGRGFPVWDLPAALDVARMLAGEHRTRGLSLGSRIWTGVKRECRCLVSSDWDDAWKSFLRLLSSAD